MMVMPLGGGRPALAPLHGLVLRAIGESYGASDTVTALLGVVAGATVLSGFFALTHSSLRVARWHALEGTFTGPSGARRLDRLDRHLHALRLTTSFLRSLANLALIAATMFLIEVWQHGPGALAAAMVTVNRDLAARARATEALREVEERSRVVLDTAKDGIIALDEQGTIEGLNPAAARIFGYEAASRIVKLAHDSGRSIRQTALEEGALTPERFDELISPEAVCRLGSPDLPGKE
jgi:PAS domain-containing protein